MGMSEDAPISLIDYLYELPKELIAQHPVSPRDASRLMHVSRLGGTPSHYHFRDIVHLLRPGDLLVTNETEVFPARLKLQKPSGGRVELVLLKPVGGDVSQAHTWEAIGRPGAALVEGRQLLAGDGTRLNVVAKHGRTVVVQGEEPLLAVAQRLGEVPLPPYIHRPDGPHEDDRASYQTIFAREPGSAAAPTASLHFTPSLLEQIAQLNVQRASLTLHVGLGTFLPIDESVAADIRAHQMHSEWFSVSEATREAIQSTKSAGGRVIAIGTTVARALESLAHFEVAEGETELFIYPGFEFRVVDGLVTNFHLPGSTLLLLTAAFASRDVMMGAYRLAVAEKYRFFSYGDAMFIE